MSPWQQRRLYDCLVLNTWHQSHLSSSGKGCTGVKAKAAVLTLLSPPDTARMLAVMDQLTCQTTSLNLCSSFGDQEFPEASSHVQINTRPSCKSTETKAGHKNHNPELPWELHFQITACTPPLMCLHGFVLSTARGCLLAMDKGKAGVQLWWEKLPTNNDLQIPEKSPQNIYVSADILPQNEILFSTHMAGAHYAVFLMFKKSFYRLATRTQQSI